MVAKRCELSDGQWARAASLLPGKAGDPGRTGSDNRVLINDCLWGLRSSAHWRDLAERYTDSARTLQPLVSCRHLSAALLEGQTGNAVQAGKAYDSNALRQIIAM
jgi:transposase